MERKNLKGEKEVEKSKNKNKRGILWMLALICVMSFFTKTTTFAATVKTVDMQDLGSGMYAYLGMLKNSKTTMYHRIKIEKKGLLLVTGGIFTSDGERYGMNTCLYDSNRRSLEPYGKSYVDVTTEKFVVYGVNPGTYYIQVKNQKYYQISAAVLTAKDYGGVSKKKAQTLVHKKRLGGLVPAGEKGTGIEWFKFKLNRNKKVKIELAALGNTGFRFYLYGPSYKKGICMASLENDALNFQKKEKLKKGTYYIKVVRVSKKRVASGYYDIRWVTK